MSKGKASDKAGEVGNLDTRAYARTLNDGPAEVVPINSGRIKTHPKNPRRGDLEAIKVSIGVNGFYGTITANRRTGHILAGNHRFLAARELGFDAVPVVWVDVGRAEEERILAADNRTSDLGVYDNAALASLLEGLSLEAGGLEGTGYEDEDLDELLAGLEPAAEEEFEAHDVHEGDGDASSGLDAALRLAAKWGTERGQIWTVGAHRLMCGDCRVSADLRALFGDARASLVFTSPPYASQRNYDDSASEFRPIRAEEYSDWYDDVQKGIGSALAPKASYFLNIKEHSEGGARSLYVKELVLAHAKRWGWCLIDEFCWRNTRNGVPGTWPNRFKNAWEPVFHFAKDTSVNFYPDSVKVESDGVFEYRKDRKASLTGSGFLASEGKRYETGLALPSNVVEAPAETRVREHPAPFPVELARFFVLAFSAKGDAVFDPFMGSGTTAIACERLGRRAFGMELSPAYLAVQLERLSELGLSPTLNP